MIPSLPPDPMAGQRERMRLCSHCPFGDVMEPGECPECGKGRMLATVNCSICGELHFKSGFRWHWNRHWPGR